MSSGLRPRSPARRRSPREERDRTQRDSRAVLQPEPRGDRARGLEAHARGPRARGTRSPRHGHRRGERATSQARAGQLAQRRVRGAAGPAGGARSRSRDTEHAHQGPRARPRTREREGLQVGEGAAGSSEEVREGQ